MAALQLTRDDADHEAPRLGARRCVAPVLLAAGAGTTGHDLGSARARRARDPGSPARLAAATSAMTANGSRSSSPEGHIELVVAARDGAAPGCDRPPAVRCLLPLTSLVAGRPADRVSAGYAFATHTSIAVPQMAASPPDHPRSQPYCPVSRGPPMAPESSAARRAKRTVLYLPTITSGPSSNGNGIRQLTFGEASYVDPDVDATGLLVAGGSLRNLTSGNSRLTANRSTTFATACRSRVRPDRCTLPLGRRQRP